MCYSLGMFSADVGDLLNLYDHVQSCGSLELRTRGTSPVCSSPAGHTGGRGGQAGHGSAMSSGMGSKLPSILQNPERPHAPNRDPQS